MTRKKPGSGGARLAVRGLLVAVVLVVVAVVALAAWFAVAGRDFVWSRMRPGEAELLAGEEIPERLEAAGWEEDLDFLDREVPRRYARFDATVDRDAFAARIGELRERLPTLGRAGRLLGLMDVMALPAAAGAGHTGVFPLQRPFDWRLYPFHAYLFDDGLWITLAGAGAERAQGAQVLALGGRPVDEVLVAAAPSVSADNASGRKHRLASYLSFAGFLRGLGVTEEDGSVELRLRTASAEETGAGGEPFTLRLEPFALASLDGLRWGRRLQESVDSWSPADPRPRRRYYELEYRADQRLLIFRFNAVRNEPDGESLEEFAERLAGFPDTNPVDRFVIDLRVNGGGNNQLAEPLVEAISGHPVLDRRGVLYTLLGRRTYSAAGNFACALERRTKTLFVGEPGGFTPNHAGDAVALPLPRSRVLVDVSTRTWHDGGPFDLRPWIEPDLPVPLRHGDHAAGRDPVLAAALAHRAEPPATVAPDALPEEASPSALAGRWRFGPFHLLQLAPGDEGTSVEVAGVEPFLTSALYPVAVDGSRVRFATDLEGVHFTFDAADGALAVDWHGEEHPLPAAGEDFHPPVELLREGRLEEGAAAYRRLAAAGHYPDSRTEFFLNRLGYRLLSEERSEDALAVFRLQAELYPTVPNAFDSLGDAYRRAGRPDEAADAYRRALDLDPGFGHPRRMLEELGR